MRSALLRQLAALGAVAALILTTGVGTASATSSKGWPVVPGSFGIMYGTTDAETFAAVRAWEAATWCRIQPTPDADMQAILASTLGAQLDAQRATGATAAIVGLGHPPAWVFNNSAKAHQAVVQYGCDANHAAGVSIPTYASLKRSKSGALPLQAQRWDAYVGAVIDFLNNRYGQSMTILLQVWNEPNLTSGLSVKTRVPGSARTVKDAVNALYELERITAAAVRARGNPAITLTSTSMHQRTNEFFNRYLAKHGRKPMVSSLSFNVYSIKKSPDAMVADWNARAERIRKKVNKYRKLRRLPAYITETNLNLVNNGRDTSNLAARVTDPAAQRRMATAIQMDAFYKGFRSVYWLAGPQVQSAVNVWHYPGTPSRAALGVLRGQLSGMVINGCATKSGVRTCAFRDPSGARAPLKVHWRMSKSSTLKLTRASTVVQMTGEVTTLPAGTRLKVGTTPMVVKPA